MHHQVKSYLDQFAEAWKYSFEQLEKVAPEWVKGRPEFLASVNTSMIGLDKNIAFPLLASTNASEEAPKEQPTPAEEKPKDTPKGQATLKDAPETVPGEFPYDKDHMHWTWCPVCHNRDIDQVSDKTGKHYQACGPCKVYLNSDGKVVRIGSGERVKATGKQGEAWRWIKVEV